MCGKNVWRRGDEGGARKHADESEESCSLCLVLVGAHDMENAEVFVGTCFCSVVLSLACEVFCVFVLVANTLLFYSL